MKRLPQAPKQAAISSPVPAPAGDGSDFTSTDLYELQQKYEKLLLFTIELTAARDRLQKQVQLKDKEITVS